MNINLLQETVETLEQNGKSLADVEWVGIKNNSYYTWEEFEEQAKCVEYDADYEHCLGRINYLQKYISSLEQRVELLDAQIALLEAKGLMRKH